MPHQEASEETALLSGITARIGQGSYVAFTGPVRAGKSTLLNLLMRFRDPSAGAVYADNADLRTVTQASLREQIGIVQQESFIFNATIRENIRLGRTDASEEALADAAKQAGLYDLIVAMPRGFDTLAGTNGVNLSSGMAQRLAIARAMIRNPSILLLDEVVSPVGPAEEVALLKTIRGLARGRTVISVSHRLTAIKDAEHIYVLEHGRIVEQGSHAELLALAGFYARMWDKQSGFRFLADGVNVEAGHVKVDPSRLRLVPVLADLSGAELADLAIHFATETFPEGREIVHQDHPAEKLFILVRGEAERWHTQEEAVLLEEGDCFGDEAFTPGSSVVETVTALTACTCISLHRCYYEQIMARV
jgi:ATP-binding cassette, subfamily B, bacterial